MSRTVVAISSFVMRGTVGLRAAVFALERRGATVWAAPTVILPWHPGLGPSTRAAVDPLPKQLDELAAHAGAVDLVLTGYFASAAQVDAAARFIKAVRETRRDALVVVDPVTGDENGRYVPDAVAEA
ncbi:MAG: pyridoxal kinase, partial [Pseudomonadota bacterium]